MSLRVEDAGIQTCPQCGGRVCPECGSSHLIVDRLDTHKLGCAKCGLVLKDVHIDKAIPKRRDAKEVSILTKDCDTTTSKIKWGKGTMTLDTHVWESRDGSKSRAISYTLTVREGSKILEAKSYQKFPAVLRRITSFLYKTERITTTERHALLVLSTAAHSTLRHILKGIRIRIAFAGQPAREERTRILREIMMIKLILDTSDRFATVPTLHIQDEIPLTLLIDLCEDEDSLSEDEPESKPKSKHKNPFTKRHKGETYVLIANQWEKEGTL